MREASKGLRKLKTLVEKGSACVECEESANKQGKVR